MAAEYVIEGPLLPWLWPSLALAGLACQALAAILKLRHLLWPGLALTLAGCWPERDLVLAVGDLVLCITLYFLLRKI